MHVHHRKRRLPVEHRGQRVPNLYRRPKAAQDRQEGDTFEVIFRDETGAQRQKTLKSRSLQRAVAEAEDYRTQLRRGELVVSSRLTFGEAAEEFLQITEALVATGERSRRTLDLYRQKYTKHVAPVLAKKRIQDVRPDHISAIFAAQRRAGLAAWTISGTQTIISAILSFSLSRGYIATSPLSRLSRIERPRQVSRREAQRLTEEEIRRLCESATPRYRPVITTLAWTGLRVSEALALQWKDIDFETNEIRVCRQLDGYGSTKAPKTRAAIRTVPLLPVLDHTLRQHRKQQLAEGLAGQEHFVFCSMSGQPLDRHNVRDKGVVAAALKAGLQGAGETVTTHDLRRTFTSHLIVRLGLDPVRVSNIAGHANVSVTLNVYADEFDRAMHRDDLIARINKAGFGSVEGALTSG
jgi:integrase